VRAGLNFGKPVKKKFMVPDTIRPLHERLARASMASGVMMIKNCRTTSIALSLLAAFTMLAASPARADRCDDLAVQLKNQIDGLTVGKTAANVIYLSHPQAKELSLGCAGRSYSNQLYAKSASRKPTPAFVDLVAGGAAIIFTLPKDDMLKGVKRCVSRMGLMHGDDVTTRYRRLDMRCARTRTEASIAVSRSTDQ
jgi:hypothetical protein